MIKHLQEYSTRQLNDFFVENKIDIQNTISEKVKFLSENFPLDDLFSRPINRAYLYNHNFEFFIEEDITSNKIISLMVLEVEDNLSLSAKIRFVYSSGTLNPNFINEVINYIEELEEYIFKKDISKLCITLPLDIGGNHSLFETLIESGFSVEAIRKYENNQSYIYMLDY